jgi:hypothetical protein
VAEEAIHAGQQEGGEDRGAYFVRKYREEMYLEVERNVAFWLPLNTCTVYVRIYCHVGGIDLAGLKDLCVFQSM